MTDDTGTPEHEDEPTTASLPLIDTFAALEAELGAKEDRIERLVSELQRAYADPTAGDSETGIEAADADAEPATASDGPANSEPSEAEPRSHEDWEPATDPLNDTGFPDAGDDQPGVTAEAATGATDAVDTEETTDPEATDPETTDPESTVAADDSRLKPVRTAGSRSPDAGTRSDASTESAGSESVERPAEREFGLTMETASNLTGGSLRSSAKGRQAGKSESESGGSERVDRPDPTADRGERLSRLARRAELRSEEAVVETFVDGIEAFDDVTREMLAHYREAGEAAPVDAHVAAGGSGERQYAYARNRTLRKAGLIEHGAAGRYRYDLPSLVEEAFDGSADAETVANAVSAIESATDLA